MRVCFAGDSFVNGTGDPDGLGWVGRLTQGLVDRIPDFTLYNLGVRRDTSSLILARWRGECLARLPQGCDGRVVFSFGVNDCVAAIPLAETLANGAAMLDQAGQAGWPALMVGPPPIGDNSVNERVADVSAALERLCTSLGVAYLPVISALSRSRTWMAEVAAGDGAHPGAAGYGELADLVRQWPAWRAWTKD